ncbi:MAG: hypothetical protein C7B46_19975 [Sulfobacillus benefaciens]|uniref:Uncharacterized protein n=1 Tax=Sulfobacillus benefaciens TaxID=453960 RepID=A0A2T2WVX7_9FIRM|nr:MAG: hypothetical protein C7B46_19975 [Sulfobacillus benefaciens]
MQILVQCEARPDVDPQDRCPVAFLFDTEVDQTMELAIGDEDGDGLIPHTILTIHGRRSIYQLYLACQTYLQGVGFLSPR